MLARKKVLLIAFFVILNISAPVLAARNTPLIPQNPAVVTVETTPQLQLAQVAPETPATMEDVSNANKNLRNDINVLLQQVNNLSQEINELKASGNEKATIQEMAQENIELLSAILGLIVFLIILISLLFHMKLKGDTRRNVKSEVENMVKSSKQELAQDFAIQEDEMGVSSSKFVSNKMEEFNENLEGNYSVFLGKVNEDLDSSFNKFEQNIQHLINKRLDKFSYELESKFEDGKVNLMSKVEEVLPSGELNTIILKLAKDNGLLNEISEELRENINQMVQLESENLQKQLESTEHRIISDIEKVHLANNHFNIGNVFMKFKNYQEAVDEFEAAIAIEPEFYGAYINLGNACEKTKELQKAENIYCQAVKLRPDYFKAYFNLGNLMKRQKKYDEAIKNYKSVIELKTDFPKAYNNMGTIFQITGNLEDAKRCYEKAINIDNNYADAYYNLSSIEAAKNNENNDLFLIAEDFMKKNNASKETYEIVKNLALQK